MLCVCEGVVSADHRALQDVSGATFPLLPHPGAAGHRSAYMTCSPTLTTGDYTHYLTSKQPENKTQGGHHHGRSFVCRVHVNARLIWSVFVHVLMVFGDDG